MCLRRSWSVRGIVDSQQNTILSLLQCIFVMSRRLDTVRPGPGVAPRLLAVHWSSPIIRTLIHKTMATWYIISSPYCVCLSHLIIYGPGVTRFKSTGWDMCLPQLPQLLLLYVSKLSGQAVIHPDISLGQWLRAAAGESCMLPCSTLPCWSYAGGMSSHPC